MSDIRFSNLDETGHETNVSYLSKDTISHCPSFIFLPEHYRTDGSCRHDEVICEYDSCDKLKYDEEIYCEDHC